jgi:hypothetical protein
MTERDPIPVQTAAALIDRPAMVLRLDDEDTCRSNNNVIDVTEIKPQAVEDVELLRQPGQNEPDILFTASSTVVAICSGLEAQDIDRTPAPQPEQQTADDDLEESCRPAFHAKEDVRQESHTQHWKQSPMQQAITLEIRRLPGLPMDLRHVPSPTRRNEVSRRCGLQSHPGTSSV